MGCGGSKQDVASGNTVGKRRREKKSPSDAHSPAAKASLTSVAPADAAGGCPALADAKDVMADTDAGEVTAPAGEEEGNLLGHSPDRYFSSRKDDDSVDAVSGGGYFSPRCTPRYEDAGPKALQDAAAEAEEAGPSMAVADGEKGAAVAKERNAVDLKEPILVQERKLEVTIIEKKSITAIGGEVVSVSSNQ